MLYVKLCVKALAAAACVTVHSYTKSASRGSLTELREHLIARFPRRARAAVGVDRNGMDFPLGPSHYHVRRNVRVRVLVSRRIIAHTSDTRRSVAARGDHLCSQLLCSLSLRFPRISRVSEHILHILVLCSRVRRLSAKWRSRAFCWTPRTPSRSCTSELPTGPLHSHILLLTVFLRVSSNSNVKLAAAASR